MAIDFGRKALSKLSGFLSSAKISRCASPPVRENGMEAEFEEIEQNQDWNRIYCALRSRADVQNVTSRAARKPENRKLNRYTDVLPFDHSRVVLTRGDIDYINANTVTYERAKRTYVLTQGPLEDTVGHFWLMVWEQKAPSIVMLNKIIEKQRIKCHKYWPDADEPLDIADMQLSVQLLSEDENDSYVRRVLKLTDTASNDSRELVQFQYTEWPDFGIPQCPDEFLRFLDLVRGSGLLSNETGPPVIHCSAGIGRSGTFCLVDVILKMLEDGTVKDNGDIDVQEILLELRKSRIGLIQTPDQLKFAYIVLIEAVNRRRAGADSTVGSPPRATTAAAAAAAGGAAVAAATLSPRKASTKAAAAAAAGAGATTSTTGTTNTSAPCANAKVAADHDGLLMETENSLDEDDDDEDDDGDELDEQRQRQRQLQQQRQEADDEASRNTNGINEIAIDEDDGDGDDDEDDEEDADVVLRMNAGNLSGSEARVIPQQANKGTNTNGPELDADTTQDGAGEQKDEELQTEAEEEPLDEDDRSEGDDDGSSPQKRAHHRLSLNNSDLKEEPTLKRNKSQDE